MKPGCWVFTSLLAGVLLNLCFRCAADTPSDEDHGSLSFHAALGGQNHIPGGTYALGQETSAMSLMFERSNLWNGFGLAFRYLNEGYLGPQNEPAPMPLMSPLHYRDAFALLLSRWWPINAPCRLGAHAGVETFFDTTATDFRATYEDRHGLGAQIDLEAQCNITRSVSVELTATRSFDVASFDSSALLIGFVFTPQDCRQGNSYEGTTRRGYFEITVGRVDVDDFDVSHDDGTITWVTYGRQVTGPFGFDFSLLRERVDDVVDRRGGALQFTAEHAFWSDWLHVFAGVGPYLAHSIDYERNTNNTQVNLLISYGLRIMVGKGFSILAKLGRVASGAGRDDSDLATFGFSLAVP